MKQLSFFLVALMAFAAPAAAQINPAKGVQTVVINTPTVQCEECKARIEKYLSHEEGILKVEVDYKKKTTKVKYLADRTNVENIKTLIANAGYDADDITAEPDSYKRLPICCKKPEDGGGHPKTH
jgi:mercuric ion binding protein